MLVLVRRVAPFELLRGEPETFAEQRDAGFDWLEIDPRRHMDLATAARDSRVLLEGGFEASRTEMHARQANVVHAGG
jgi:hypothetical protein